MARAATYSEPRHRNQERLTEPKHSYSERECRKIAKTRKSLCNEWLRLRILHSYTSYHCFAFRPLSDAVRHSAMDFEKTFCCDSSGTSLANPTIKRRSRRSRHRAAPRPTLKPRTRTSFAHFSAEAYRSPAPSVSGGGAPIDFEHGRFAPAPRSGLRIIVIGQAASKNFRRYRQKAGAQPVDSGSAHHDVVQRNPIVAGTITVNSTNGSRCTTLPGRMTDDRRERSNVQRKSGKDSCADTAEAPA